MSARLTFSQHSRQLFSNWKTHWSHFTAHFEDLPSTFKKTVQIHLTVFVPWGGNRGDVCVRLLLCLTWSGRWTKWESKREVFYRLHGSQWFIPLFHPSFNTESSMKHRLSVCRPFSSLLHSKHCWTFELFIAVWTAITHLHTLCFVVRLTDCILTQQCCIHRSRELFSPETQIQEKKRNKNVTVRQEEKTHSAARLITHSARGRLLVEDLIASVFVLELLIGLELSSKHND